MVAGTKHVAIVAEGGREFRNKTIFFLSRKTPSSKNNLSSDVQEFCPWFRESSPRSFERRTLRRKEGERGPRVDGRNEIGCAEAKRVKDAPGLLGLAKRSRYWRTSRF